MKTAEALYQEFGTKHPKLIDVANKYLGISDEHAVSKRAYLGHFKHLMPFKLCAESNWLVSIDVIEKCINEYGEVKILDYGDIKFIDDANNRYTINKNGDVFDIEKHRIIKHHLTDDGYPAVSIKTNGKISKRKVHRLVAIGFIERVEGKDCINHIDGDKNNFSINNLEWCTLSENTKHAWRTGLIFKSWLNKGLVFNENV